MGAPQTTVQGFSFLFVSREAGGRGRLPIGRPGLRSGSSTRQPRTSNPPLAMKNCGNQKVSWKSRNARLRALAAMTAVRLLSKNARRACTGKPGVVRKLRSSRVPLSRPIWKPLTGCGCLVCHLHEINWWGSRAVGKNHPMRSSHTSLIEPFVLP
jgi:hypothetical protein